MLSEMCDRQYYSEFWGKKILSILPCEAVWSRYERYGFKFDRHEVLKLHFKCSKNSIS